MSEENNNNQQPPKDKKSVVFATADIDVDLLERNNLKKNSNGDQLSYIIQQATGSAKKSNAPRIAFTEDPVSTDHYAGVFKTKKGLLPDHVLKMIRMQNHLIASILRARANTLSMFGHIKKNRFDIGIAVDIKPEFEQHVTQEQMVKIRDRIEKFKKLLLNCGHTEGLKDHEKMSLSEFFYLQTIDGLSLGRLATEIIYEDGDNGNPNKLSDRAKKFHRFRPVDAGTINKAVKNGESASGLRASGIRLLESVTNKKIDGKLFEQDEYAYVQVIDNMPKQAFSADEMIVFNLYPSNDIEHNGYPVTPVDTCISSVTTHLSIDSYNKLYFQNGRAAKGILVINSEEIDQATINTLKQEFMASINNVGNSFRVPVFGVGENDKINWLPMVSSSGDGEFQFLYDAVARNILSTFSMSPDELPGYGHLSRGTNQKTLSECFPLENQILTRSGLISAEDLLGENKENKIEVWTGERWEKARIFYTGPKELRETTLQSNLRLKTSPDHRFQIVGEDGNLEWKQQKDLTLDDVVLVNSTPVEGFEESVPEFLGKKITPELMEVLGWMSGDGSITPNKKRAGGKVTLYYHNEKELDVRERHLKILNDFGIDANPVNKEISQEESEKLAEKYGFSSTSTLRTSISIYNTKFTKWLEENGFLKNKIKSIPSFLHTLPVLYRYSFLRGLFSADGHVTEPGSIILTIQEKNQRESVRQILIGLGIRTTSMEGINRSSFGKKEFSYKLSIKDRNKFWQNIGFIQDHKQNRKREQLWIIDEIPKKITSILARLILADDNSVLSKMDRDALMSASKKRTNMSKNRIIELAKQTRTILPDWLEKFHVEKIKSISNLEEVVEMADIEVFNNEHAFTMHGIRVHNSNNEFKLTAARDTGLRPLILRFQSLLNEKIFPIMDPELAQICTIQLSGLDAQSREEESLRLQQDMPIHMDYDQVLSNVDKEPVGARMAGKVPMNERYQIIADKYLNVAEIMAEYMEDPTALADPLLRYKRDPFFIQSLQILMQTNPGAVKAYFATKPHTLDILKLTIEDFLEEIEEDK